VGTPNGQVRANIDRLRRTVTPMYQLTTGETILRLSDNASIPQAPGNRDYRKYLEWLEAGNSPEPAPAPLPPPPKPTIGEKLTRIGLTPQDLVAVLEGASGVTIADIKKAVALAKKGDPI
jgi:hypothetical protein